MFCSKCGGAVAEQYAFCTKCGSPAPQAAPNGGLKDGAPKVSRSRTILLVLSLILVTWLGTAGIAYGVVDLTGGGPQGEQGEQGPKGERGPAGPAGASATDFGTSAGLRRLAGMYAITSLLKTGDYTSLSTGHPQVQACIDYIMNGTGSGVECGFQRAE